jgi:hypothetical protein
VTVDDFPDRGALGFERGDVGLAALDVRLRFAAVLREERIAMREDDGVSELGSRARTSSLPVRFTLPVK